MDLRRTFNQEALLYQKARPHYPPELFDRLINVTNIKSGDHLLEIGPGTGQATVPLAERGFRITGVELGGHLADVVRHAVSHYPAVDIITGAFEDAEFPRASFKLIYSATAFHWIKPEVKFAKTHELLAPRGHLAIIHTSHVSDEHGDEFQTAIQPIYDAYWPRHKDPEPLPLLNELKPPELDERLFRSVDFQVFPVAIRYSAKGYAELLNTYSPTLALPNDKRAAFLHDIQQYIQQELGGYHTKCFGMTLAIAQSR